MEHADTVEPGALNRIIWFSVRGASESMPAVARLPAFDAMLACITEEDEEEQQREEAEIVKTGSGPV